jgi:glutathione S-transferase
MPMNVEYWEIRGLGHQIRCMAFYLDLDFIDTRLGFEDAPGYFQRKGEGAAGNNPLINLPSITNGDVFVSETSACILYLLEIAGRVDMSDTTWQRQQMTSIIGDIYRG